MTERKPAWGTASPYRTRRTAKSQTLHAQRCLATPVAPETPAKQEGNKPECECGCRYLKTDCELVHGMGIHSIRLHCRKSSGQPHESTLQLESLHDKSSGDGRLDAAGMNGSYLQEHTPHEFVGRPWFFAALIVCAGLCAVLRCSQDTELPPT